MSDGTNSKDPSQVAQPTSGATGPSAPNQAGPVAEAPAKKGWGAAIRDIFKTLLFKPVETHAEKHGPGVFVGFAIGLVLGVGGCLGVLAQFESIRKFLWAPPSVERPPTTGPQEKREKLSVITFSMANSPPPFLADYQKLLAKIGESERPAEATENPPVGIVEYMFTVPVHGFAFRLRPRYANSQINARIFRQVTTGDDPNNRRDIYEPVRLQGGSSQEGFTYKVGECNAKDKLYMVLLVIPQQPGVTKFTDYFDVTIG